MLRSSKNADQRKQWWYRVAGYSAVAPKHVILTVNGQSFHPMYMSFSKSGRRNNAKSAFQYTVNNNTT